MEGKSQGDNIHSGKRHAHFSLPSISVHVTFAHPEKTWRFRKHKKDSKGKEVKEEEEDPIKQPPNPAYLSESSLKKRVGRDGKDWDVLVPGDVFLAVDGGLLGATVVVASGARKGVDVRLASLFFLAFFLSFTIFNSTGLGGGQRKCPVLFR
jgi:hypothetical protein